MSNNRPFRAFWVGRGAAQVPVLPLRGAKFLLYILVAILIIAFLVDWRLGRFAAEGRVNSPDWIAHDQVINRENHAKIYNSITDPIFRSAGYTPPPPRAERRRILVIGDSFIWGDGLTNLNMTWWRQLQWELDRRGYRNVDVIAAGVNGASTQDQYGWLTDGKLLEQTKPDAIVFGYVTNDPIMKDASGREMVRQRSPNLSVDLVSTVLGKFFPHLAYEISHKVNNKRDHLLGDDNGYPYSKWDLKILEGDNFNAYRDLLSRLAKTIDKAGVPAFFVTTPNYPNTEIYEPRYAPVRAAFLEAGIRLVDLLPQLVECCAGTVGSELLWGTSPSNGHPGSQLTNFYARHVADILEQEYPSVLGPRSEQQDEVVASINDWLPSTLSPKQVGPGEWEMNLPVGHSTQLFMPVKKPHVALNFEHPIDIASIKLQSDKVSNYHVWAQIMSEDGSHELRDYVNIGSGTGLSVAMSMPASLTGKLVTSLRIAADSKEPAVKEVLVLDPSKMSEKEGHSYFYPLPPEMEASSDASEYPGRSKLVLIENNTILPRAHQMHDDIRFLGSGRYSHWGSGLLFSSSDNSDPRTNKRYSLGELNSLPIKITIESVSKAVRP